MNLFVILLLGLVTILQTVCGYATCKGAFRMYLEEQKEKSSVDFLTQWEVYRQCEVLPISDNRVASFHSEVQCKCPNKKEQNIYELDKPKQMYCKSEITIAQAAQVDFSKNRLPQELEDLYRCIHKEKSLQAQKKASLDHKYYM
ncbi:uncharacterized protein LOC123011957 [Tribolium madens]|uniref:uncharacterized protein LOC123011957 n=1 Tax=Tribolium madens TaxID=41895 RepID=UPI001CF76136|nr:uncharacterized protein LOC123011957 [Tribolium madens]